MIGINGDHCYSILVVVPAESEVVDGVMRPSPFGYIIDWTWHWLAERYRYLRLDTHVVMPNHLHGVLWIVDDDSYEGGRGSSRTAPTDVIDYAQPACYNPPVFPPLTPPAKLRAA